MGDRFIAVVDCLGGLALAVTMIYGMNNLSAEQSSRLVLASYILFLWFEDTVMFHCFHIKLFKKDLISWFLQKQWSLL